MSMIWKTARRGSIALAGTFLALDLTGSSATAMVGRNIAVGAVAGGNSVSSSVSRYVQVEQSETVRKCANGLQYVANEYTCDAVELVNG